MKRTEFLFMKILLSQAKLFFAQGLLSGFYVERVDNNDNWILHLTFSDCNMAEAMIIDARRKEVRVQTISSCIKTLEDIGFVVDKLEKCSTNA